MSHMRRVLIAAVLGCVVAVDVSAQGSGIDSPARTDARQDRTLSGATGAQGSQAGDSMRGSAGTAKSERELDATAGRSRANAQDRWVMTHRASKIIGTEVRNAEGEDLGDIKEIVLDPRTGEVSYAVISFGGVLGLGDKLFAVPWKALKLDSKDNTFVLNVEKERLKGAPGFDPDRWPDMANSQWNSDVHKFYGERYGANTQRGRVGAAPKRESHPAAPIPPATGGESSVNR